MTLSEIKQLLYKYYSNPKSVFTFIDSSQNNLMDFEKYHVRKDGMLDMVEWTNAFDDMKWKPDDIKPRNKEVKRQLIKLRK